MRWVGSKRRLPDSLTQHLSDPKIVAFRSRADQRRANHRTEATKRFYLSIVTLIVLVLAGGYLLRLW
ncbi:hypothetical protein SAMN05192568_1023106 [Methylobacterium pseudosasicola]|uniref:Uncharacterized protein n=1 Tax=Methylobacterium pseudosasicola TaxID=582667 RepID=A0A1I4P8A9_9HYPH|nr:hypothetical protein SAMN05192568_1023106 [Methylobacterium pseudosasicola]